MEDGSVSLRKLLHWANALRPIYVILSGIVMDVIPVHLAKALLHIRVTGIPPISLGIVTAPAAPL